MSKTPTKIRHYSQVKLRYYGQGWRLPGSTVTHIPGSWVYLGRSYGVSACNRARLRNHAPERTWGEFAVTTNRLLCQFCVSEVQYQIDFFRSLLKILPDKDE